MPYHPTNPGSIPPRRDNNSILSNPVSHKGSSLLWRRIEPDTIPPETLVRGKLKCVSDQLNWTSLAKLTKLQHMFKGRLKCNFKIDKTRGRLMQFLEPRMEGSGIILKAAVFPPGTPDSKRKQTLSIPASITAAAAPCSDLRLPPPSR
ncbi:hypothetical protein LXL04_006363 [Taraxacum kok-saghyz]